MTGIPSSLRRVMPCTAPLGESELRALAARVWHDHGIVCVRPEEVPNDFDRQALVNAAERVYGKRGAPLDRE